MKLFDTCIFWSCFTSSLMCGLACWECTRDRWFGVAVLLAVSSLLSAVAVVGCLREYSRRSAAEKRCKAPHQVDVNYILWLEAERGKINELPFETIEWFDGEQQIAIDAESGNSAG